MLVSIRNYSKQQEIQLFLAACLLFILLFPYCPIVTALSNIINFFTDLLILCHTYEIQVLIKQGSHTRHFVRAIDN